MIKIQNLTKAFSAGDEMIALDHVNLRVDKGDIFGIIGMSGAGKSTLLRCIALLERPTEGEIFIDGVNLFQLKGRELLEKRRQMGVVFQGYNLLMQRNVRDNIAFPMELNQTPKEQIHKRVSDLLDMVGLQDKALAYPAQLSGGQKQRVAIARALANSPKILLCDEPTSALDSLTTRSILGLLRDINRKLGVTIMIITHEIGVVRAICNRVAIIDSSMLVEEGKTDEVLERPRSEITKQLLGLLGGEFRE